MESLKLIIKESIKDRGKANKTADVVLSEQCAPNFVAKRMLKYVNQRVRNLSRL